MITKMTQRNMTDYNKSNESFIVFGRIIPKYENNTWTYDEEIFTEQYTKRFEDDEIDISYIEDPNKAVYFFYAGDECVGQIRLRSNWNGFAYIENIAVAKKSRQLGIGTALLNVAIEWAKRKNFIGLMLETQDINISACRFYAKNNFVIGGVDCMLYANFPNAANEKAIFWYQKF